MTGPGGRGGRRSGPDTPATTDGQAGADGPGTAKAPATPGEGPAAAKVVRERSPRTPEQQRRAAERARAVRERRAAERAGKGTGSGRAGGPAGGTDPEREPDAPAVRTGVPSAETARFRRRRIVAGVVVVTVLLMALVAGAWWALGRFGPAVSEVRVTGNRAVSTADVRAAADVTVGVPLAAVDTAGVQARVAGIPGVATVEVGRSWPDALTVAVTERTPVAVADAPGGRRLVDATGLAYRTLPPAPPRLPLLALPRVAPDDPATRAAVAVLAALPGPIREQVESVATGPGGTTLELNLTGGRRVLWGRWSQTADTPEKAAILGPLLSREGGVYDVSSPALPTVRR